MSKEQLDHIIAVITEVADGLEGEMYVVQNIQTSGNEKEYTRRARAVKTLGNYAYDLNKLKEEILKEEE